MVKENICPGENQTPAWLKILAFLFPLFVMYGPVNDEVENPANRQLWLYIMAGLITEFLALIALAMLI